MAYLYWLFLASFGDFLRNFFLEAIKALSVQTFPIFDERYIWLIPFLFYVFESFCLIDDKHIIIVEDYRFRWTFQLAAVPFVFRGKHLYLLPILTPHVFAFNLRWQIIDRSNNYRTRRFYKRLAISRLRFCEFRLLAVFSWINLFVFGPMLTNIGGLLFALKYVMPIHIVMLVSCIFLIILNSRILKFNRRTIYTHIFELTFSPGYLPNICRRLSLEFSCEDVDGVLFIKRYAQQSTAETLINSIEFRLSEMKIEIGDSPEALRELEEYSAEIRH